MQESEFDKNVQQDLEELKMRPSETVWENLEKELQRRKRRRVVVIFFFLLAGLGLLGYSGYFFNSSSKNNEIVHSSSVPPHDQTPAREKTTARSNTIVSTNDNNTPAQDNGIDKIKTGEPAAAIAPDKGTAGKQPSASSLKPKTGTIAHAGKMPGEDRSQREPVNKVNRVNRDNKVSKGDQVVSNTKATGNDKKVSTPDPVVASAPTPIPSSTIQPGNTITAATAATLPVDATAIATTKDSIAKKDSEQVTAAPATSPSVSNPHKIRWGIEWFGGAASSRDFALVPQPSTRDYVNSAVSGGSGGGSIPAYYPQLPRSDVKAGPAFSIGVSAEKKISKRGTVSAGIQYTYVSTRINVGSAVDTMISFSNALSQYTTVNTVYAGTQRQHFTNKYHFIGLPIAYQLQVNNGKKVPISWDMRATVSYLIASNGLVYNEARNGIYYHDEDVFNRVHFSLGTGFGFHFGNQRKIPWSIGPQFSFDMTRLVKPAYDQSQYLFYGGIMGKINLPKRK